MISGLVVVRYNKLPTIFLNFEIAANCSLQLELLKFRCPYLLCHIFASSCTFVLNASSLLVLRIKGKHLFPLYFTLTTRFLRDLSSNTSTL
ncbi:hypothetical protein D8674_013034 [Pyrus ussuriensis x Pyrus communis]|uniref:Uncharacterized protein n=1 Tax=Pyrus ussuriensis x Pyrus communis TaxID=2448454 RepID=A0A5N5GNL6_9ROSA|nr:hypothetical protein D8674_013034 [Pyrus ussuriensis x Pyrus communis]